jgi:hypothetical protein
LDFRAPFGYCVAVMLNELAPLCCVAACCRAADAVVMLLTRETAVSRVAGYAVVLCCCVRYTAVLVLLNTFLYTFPMDSAGADNIMLLYCYCFT